MSQASCQAMKTADVALLTLLLTLKPIRGRVEHKHGTVFRAIKDDGKENKLMHDSTSVIHKSFHKCNLDEACRYVVEDIQRKKYSMVEEGKNLRTEEKYMRIWEKLTATELMAVACEHAILRIQCQIGFKIHVKDAVFGRISTTICPNESIFTTNCAAANSLTKIKELCEENETCTVKASNGVFGDPCSRTSKYLQVKYLCL